MITTEAAPVGLHTAARDALLFGAAEQAEARRLYRAHKARVRQHVMYRLRELARALDPANLAAWEAERAALERWLEADGGRLPPGGNRNGREGMP